MLSYRSSLANFAIFSLWLPEQYETSIRATAFAFTTSFGRFIGAGVNFLIAAMVNHAGTIGEPVAYTAFAFWLSLLLIPLLRKHPGRPSPNNRTSLARSGSRLPQSLFAELHSACR
jgi:hypothetical protein